jgi:hypothetical protein
VQTPGWLALPLPFTWIVTTAPRFLKTTLGVTLTLLSLGAAGCAIAGTTHEPDSVSADPAMIAAAVTACVDQVNALRASVGDPLLTRSDRIDAFSAEAARVDGEAHQAHKHFLATNGGHGTALAENLIPWWKVSDYGSIQTVVRRGLTMMWEEGPGGHHYVNMRGTYREMGCGIADLNGEVTVSQDFR